MDYTVYCDESRHDFNNHNTFMAIGGLWVPSERKKVLTKKLRMLLKDLNINGEVKWSKVSKLYFEKYKKIIDYFFSESDISFRCIVVEHEKIDYKSFHGGDKELGFYIFYYEMLIKWIQKDNEYLILLDYKNNKGADRYTTLKYFLEKNTRKSAWIKDLTIINSYETPLAQVADLLTGAVAANWSGTDDKSPKGELIKYIASKCNKESLKFHTLSPDMCKFNIFKIDLS